MRSVLRWLPARRLARDRTGAILPIIGIGAPVLFGAAGLAVDYSVYAAQHTKLQQAADTAALAIARELQLARADKGRMQSIAESIVSGKVTVRPGDGPLQVLATEVGKARAPGSATKTGEKDAGGGVRVRVSQRMQAILGRLVTPGLTDLSVTATATPVGGTRVCVIGLDERSPDTVVAIDKAKITAPNCSVHANSTSPAAIRAEGSAVISALQTCSGGGFKQASSKNFQPSQPITDCPKAVDPLIDRPPPGAGACAANAKPLVLEKVTRTLMPGTYCGGLVVGPGARVTLSAGIYVMKNGPLVVGPGGWVATGGPRGGDDDDDDDDDDDGGSGQTGFLRGTNVGIYFTGKVAAEKDGLVRVMKLMKDSVVELTAPRDGPMAGLLFYEDRSSPSDRRYEVLSDSARRLVGTIYLPRGIFNVRANQSVADQSEYTAIVTRRLDLSKAPNLVINTRYADTDVPVPAGIGPNGTVRLTQ